MIAQPHSIKPAAMENKIAATKQNAKLLLKELERLASNEYPTNIVLPGWTEDELSLARDMMLQALNGPEGKRVYDAGLPPIKEIALPISHARTERQTLTLTMISQDCGPSAIDFSAWTDAVSKVNDLLPEAQRRLLRIGTPVQLTTSVRR